MSKEGEEFEKYMLLQMQKQLIKVVSDTERILQENIQNELYDVYNPSYYERTAELKNSLVKNIRLNDGEVIFDESKLNHTSVVSGNSVGKYVPLWTDMGHHDKSGIDNMYHNYEGRGYVDKTIKMLEKKYGEGCVEKIDT